MSVNTGTLAMTRVGALASGSSIGEQHNEARVLRKYATGMHVHHAFSPYLNSILSIQGTGATQQLRNSHLGHIKMRLVATAPPAREIAQTSVKQ